LVVSAYFVAARRFPEPLLPLSAYQKYYPAKINPQK